MEKDKKHIEKSKDYIACAIEELREISENSEVYEESQVDDCIRNLEDIQLLRL